MIKNVFGYSETVKMGRFTFRIHQPTILQLDRIGFQLDFDDTKLRLLNLMSDEPLRIISKAVTLRFPFLWVLVYWYIKKRATWAQIKDAYMVLHGVVFGRAIFASCNLDEVTSETISDLAGGKTIIGQVPTFCEYLNFTKQDVLTTPYPVLLLMCADKQRVLGENDVVKVKMGARDYLKEYGST